MFVDELGTEDYQEPANSPSHPVACLQLRYSRTSSSNSDDPTKDHHHTVEENYTLEEISQSAIQDSEIGDSVAFGLESMPSDNDDVYVPCKHEQEREEHSREIWQLVMDELGSQADVVKVRRGTMSCVPAERFLSPDVDTDLRPQLERRRTSLPDIKLADLENNIPIPVPVPDIDQAERKDTPPPKKQICKKCRVKSKDPLINVGKLDIQLCI